jgi:hypothetical protein
LCGVETSTNRIRQSPMLQTSASGMTGASSQRLDRCCAIKPTTASVASSVTLHSPYGRLRRAAPRTAAPRRVVMQQAQSGDWLVEFGLEVILLKTEVGANPRCRSRPSRQIRMKYSSIVSRKPGVPSHRLRLGRARGQAVLDHSNLSKPHSFAGQKARTVF